MCIRDSSYADKPLIAAILGGLFVGIGAGLIVRRGGASGGDDALALILHQVTGWKISRSYFFTDFVVLMLSISYIPLRNIFFSLLTVTLSSAVIELLQKSRQKMCIRDRQKTCRLINFLKFTRPVYLTVLRGYRSSPEPAHRT